jgi:hypothetical protein
VQQEKVLNNDKQTMTASSSNHVHQYNHDSDYQQNVNEPTHGVRSYQPQQPQDKHNNGNGIKHDIHLSIKWVMHADAMLAMAQ